MSLIDELRAASTGTGGGCSVCAWIDERPDAEEWDAVMATHKSDIGHATIGRKMRSLGYLKRSDKPIERHRSERHRDA